MRRKIIDDIVSAILIVVTVLSIIFSSVSVNLPEPVSAAGVSGSLTLKRPLRTLLLSEVKVLAIAKDKTYKKIKMKIENKKAKYNDAIKRINAKKKRLSTFSWSPLLNFNFPTDPSFTEEYDFFMKPISIQCEIDILKHQLNDQIYAIYEKAINLYVQLYTLQEKIAFNEKSIENNKKTLAKNQARLAEGKANKSDVKAIEKAITRLEKQVLKDERSLNNKKDKLTKMIGMDVRTGYGFVNPYVEAKLYRTDLEKIITHTLSKSQQLYEAKTETRIAGITLDQYYNLMLNKYGSTNMAYVTRFVNAVKNGNEIDEESLKKQYDALLAAVDKKWEGNVKILFVKIPKLWFKGATAGSRYVEDEPYGLYNAILDLQDARDTEEGVQTDIRAEVKDAFENVKSLETAYYEDVENLAIEAKELKEALVKNQAGILTFEEYTELQKKYEDDQLNAAADLDAYTQALTSFDRLTCGAVTSLLSGVGMNADNTVGGNSYLVAETTEGINYYIKQMPEADVFILGLSIPDNFEIDLTKYELWIDHEKVGEADINGTIQHFCFELDGSTKVSLRFYKEDEALCDVTIDPTKYSGPVDLITGYRIVQNEEDSIITVGEYTITQNVSDGTSLFTFTASSDLENVDSYKLSTMDGNVLGDVSTKNGQSMKYLPILDGSLDMLVLTVLDSDENEIITGFIDEETMTVIAEKTGGDAD